MQRGRRAPGAKGFHRTTDQVQPSEAWEESRPSSFTADGEGRVNHAGSPSEWFREEKKNVIATILRPVNSSPYSLNRSYTVDCVPRLPPEPGARWRCSFVPVIRNGEISISGTRQTCQNGRCRQTFCTAVSMVQRKNINAQSTVTPNTLFTARLAVLQRDPEGSAMMSVVGAWATVWSLILREQQPPATPLPTCRPCLLSAALRAPSWGPASACRRRGHLVPPSAVRPPLPRAHSHPPLARSRPLRSAPCIHRRA